MNFLGGRNLIECLFFFLISGDYQCGCVCVCNSQLSQAAAVTRSQTYVRQPNLSQLSLQLSKIFFCCTSS